MTRLVALAEFLGACVLAVVGLFALMFVLATYIHLRDWTRA